MSILRCFMFLVTLLGYKHNALPVCFIVAVVVVFCGDEQKETSMSISSSWLLGNDVSPQRQSLLKNENTKYKLMAELGFFFQILYEYIETHQGPSNRMGNLFTGDKSSFTPDTGNGRQGKIVCFFHSDLT